MASHPEQTQRKHHTKKIEDKKEETLTVEDVKYLGLQLLSSRAHINNLPILLSVLSPSSPAHIILESLISLQSFFLPLLPEVPSTSSLSNQTEAEEDLDAFYNSWLRARFDELVNLLIEIAVSYNSVEALKDVALDAIMDFVKQEKEGRFNCAIYHKLIRSIIRGATPSDPLLNLLSAKYFKYIDIRYFTYTSLDKISKDCNSTTTTDDRKNNLQNPVEESESRLRDSIRTIYNVLSCVPPLEKMDEQQSLDMWSQLRSSPKDESKKSSNVFDVEANLLESKMLSTSPFIKKFKLRFTKAWLSFLKLPFPLDVYKEVLATLHQIVIPYMSNPAILCDFLTRSYDIGGVISVMALNGLFILMTQNGLEYPKFYEKLYALLKPDVFMAKHRAGFFQLLDTCLKSSHLPAYLAAAFAKKLSRLALSVPPSGELIIIALIHNLLRRHPSINFLVHQQVDDDDDLANGDASAEGDDSRESERKSNADPVVQSMKRYVDPFNNEELNPLKSNAMRSSLWEIDTLRHHYCPAVSRFVASLENDLTVRAKTSEMPISDFSSASYATIFRDEIRRRIKQCPVAFYRETPTSLFNESDFSGWSFGSQQLGFEENENKRGNDGVSRTTVEGEDRDLKRLRIESY